MTIIYAVAIGLSVGAAATVARRIGEARPRRRGTGRRAVDHHGPRWIGAVVGATGILFAPELLRLMGADEGVVPTGSTFARVMIGASGGVTLLFLINAVFRGAGDAAIAMRVLWIANADQHHPRTVPDLRPRPVSRASASRAPPSARASAAGPAC